MKYGYFDNTAREYVITRPDTPAPWGNYLGNAQFGALITNNAAGYTFYKSAVQGCLTRFRFNSTNASLAGKFVYIRDNDSNDFWSATWQPVAKPLESIKTECRHGMGYSLFYSEYSDIEVTLKYFIPMGAIHEICLVTVKNKGTTRRNLSAFPYLEPGCNWNATDDARNLQYVRFISACSGKVANDTSFASVDIGSNINMPEDVEHFENKDQARHLFFIAKAFDTKKINAVGYDSAIESFLGTYGTYAAPEVVKKGKCTNSNSIGDMPCCALQMNISLEAGEESSFAFFFGPGKPEDAEATINQYNDVDKLLSKLEEIKRHWHKNLGVLSAETPDESFNSMISSWAPYNNLMTFYWSRTASIVYAGERDGLGYRDSAQDIVGAAALVPEEAKTRLELLITGQCSTGGAMPVVKPFAHNPGHEELPSEDVYRSDDCLWLFNAIPTFVKEVGDFDFYNKILPYADKGEDTVFSHMKRAIMFNIERSGAHGLPCGLSADWNDCIKLGRKGESVFVAFQLRFALSEYIDIATRLNNLEEKSWAEEELKKLDEKLDEHTWDGEWYLRAYRENGETFGSNKNEEGKIFMNTQTWAVLSGHASYEKAMSAMNAMDRELGCKYGIALCAPPYVTTDPTVSVARLFNPGLKENGAVFNHTQGWAVIAAAKLGLNDKAWTYLKNVLPASYNDIAEIRGVEPYVVCQCTASAFSPRYGMGRVPWLSGSAVWNYVAMTTAILGIKPEYEGLRIAPCIPSDWNGYTATRTFRNRIFNIKVSRGETPSFIVNGNPINGNLIEEKDFLSTNTIEITLK